MPMLSVITLKDLITAHAALDTLEMEHHATVIFKMFCLFVCLFVFCLLLLFFIHFRFELSVV